MFTCLYVYRGATRKEVLTEGIRFRAKYRKQVEADAKEYRTDCRKKAKGAKWKDIWIELKALTNRKSSDAGMY
jgi:hypothetical protein